MKHELFEMNALLVIAADAAAEILDVYKKPEFNVERKLDNSPVTEADLRSHRTIVQGLERLTPEIPIVSEESEDSNQSALDTINSEEVYWLVDPLDGTKGFINRSDEFCVCIALIENGVPTVGIIHDPVGEAVYFAIVGEGAFEIVDGKKSQIRCRKKNEDLSVYMSKNHKGGEDDLVDKIWPGSEKHHQGSALKFCHIAAGRADVYFRTRPTSLWDTAAGQALVVAAGGEVRDFEGSTLTYIRDSLENPSFVVAGHGRLIRELLESFD